MAVWDDIVDTIVELGRGLYEAAVGFAGCVAGTAGYGVAVARMQFSGGASPRSLTAEEIAICAPILTLGGYGAVSLGRVSLITGASLGWLPGSKAGLTLGDVVYIKHASLDVCNVTHMRLLIHELVHVHQYQTLGAAQFACQYGALIAIEFDTNNELERAADRVDSDFVTELTNAIGASCAGRGSNTPAAIAAQSDWFWIVWS